MDLDELMKRPCYGCRLLESEFYEDGTTFYKCGRTPGLIVGEVGAFTDDPPFEIAACWEEPTVLQPANQEE